MTAARRLALFAGAAGLALTIGGSPAGAAGTPGAAAEGYGVFVDAHLLAGNVPVTVGPIAWAAQDSPPGAAQPATANVASAGPAPADGSLVNHIGALTTSATATAAPAATATAQTADVSLLKQAGVPLVSADLVKAQANADCAADPNGNGTQFVNLVVGGTPIANTPAPNTVIDLTIAKVVLNEQHPANDGRGIVVNAIHVISTTAGTALFQGDIVVSHAMATVNCTNGAGTTGGSSVLPITKSVTPSTVAPGGQVAYTATITNKATADCLVTEAIDHLPVGFSPVSTAGDLGTAFTTRTRPNGALDLVFGQGTTIAQNKTATQTFVVKVGAGVAPGTYFNDVEVFCANLGDFVKGLDAPVEVQAVPATTTSTAQTATAAARTPGELPATGANTRWLLVGAALTMVAGLAGRLLRRASRR
jgi:uncharacterized repeat protein (TIGR01451 family)/LPXTG-motif cell wall-anchored protein